MIGCYIPILQPDQSQCKNDDRLKMSESRKRETVQPTTPTTPTAKVPKVSPKEEDADPGESKEMPSTTKKYQNLLLFLVNWSFTPPLLMVAGKSTKRKRRKLRR